MTKLKKNRKTVKNVQKEKKDVSGTCIIFGSPRRARGPRAVNRPGTDPAAWFHIFHHPPSPNNPVSSCVAKRSHHSTVFYVLLLPTTCYYPCYYYVYSRMYFDTVLLAVATRAPEQKDCFLYVQKKGEPSNLEEDKNEKRRKINDFSDSLRFFLLYE